MTAPSPEQPVTRELAPERRRRSRAQARVRPSLLVIGRLDPPAFVETAQRDRDDDERWNELIQLLRPPE